MTESTEDLTQWHIRVTNVQVLLGILPQLLNNRSDFDLLLLTVISLLIDLKLSIAARLNQLLHASLTQAYFLLLSHVLESIDTLVLHEFLQARNLVLLSLG